MSGTFGLIWVVLFLPLVGSIVQALLGKIVVKSMGVKAGKKLMGTLAVLPIAIAFGIGAFLTMQLAGLAPENRSNIQTLYDWIAMDGFRVPFEARIDPLSMTMVLIITGIGSLIHLYATGYMADDPDYPRFFTYLNLFVASMLILVLGNNLLLMFVGWEGVGVCSYLLIGFWYKDVANAKAANKAFIVNRIGDWGLTLGIFLLVSHMLLNRQYIPNGSDRLLSYDVIIPFAVKAFEHTPLIATSIALLFFVGACGKSAQFPLYFWLPDAMAGPTPVSALIHAATMVTAGVFLLNRMHVFYEISNVASAIVAIVGAFTALFAALIAFGQTDIKKVLAYSTVSQLGFMFIACGAGAYWVGMFHVTTHAFFKALLFLGAGAVIYSMAHEQDMRNYGNLRKYLPMTFATMMVGYIAISGLAIPPGIGFAGFYSKEAVLGSALAGQHAYIGSATFNEGIQLGVFAGWIGLFVAMLTAWYMTRMTFLTFFGKEERWRSIPAHAHGDDEHHAMAHEEAEGHSSLTAHTHIAGPEEVQTHEDTHVHHHGEDVHGFFYTEEQLAARESLHEEEHHHHLDADFKPKEAPISMILPLIVLAILSIAGGFVLNGVLEKWLYPTGLAIIEPVSTHPHGIPLMALSIGAAVLGILAGAIYLKGLPKTEGWDLTKWSGLRKSAANQFGYDEAVVTAGISGGGDLANATWRWVDVGLIDGVVNGVGWLAAKLGSILRIAQTGYVRSYALLMLVGAVGILGFFLYLTNLIGATN